MTEQHPEHPTAGRGRRHESPASVPMHGLPLPKLLDHMGAEDGPSSAEERKEAKRQRSAFTTPRSARGTLPHDYDRVMGVTSVDSQESVKFEEGDDSEFKDVQETAAHSWENLDQTCSDESHHPDVTTESGEFHGG